MISSPLSGSYPEIDAVARDFESMIGTVRGREEERQETEGIVAAAQRRTDLAIRALGRKVESTLCPVDLNREVKQAGRLEMA